MICVLDCLFIQQNQRGSLLGLPVIRKDILELVRRVDHCGHCIPQNARVFGVECQRPVDDVDEQLDVGGVGKVPRHGFEHSGNESNPVEFVHNVQAIELLKIATKS